MIAPLQVLLLLSLVSLAHLQDFDFSQNSAPTISCTKNDSYFVSSEGHDNESCVEEHHFSKSRPPCLTLAFLLQKITAQDCVNVVVSYSHNFTKGLIRLNSGKSWSITGNSSDPVTIQCSNSSGIAFYKFNHIYLANLKFVNCGAWNNNTNYSSHYHLLEYSTLHFYFCSDIEIIDCGFYDGNGTGVIIVNVFGTNLIRNTHFNNNKMLKDFHQNSKHKNMTAGGLIVRSDLHDFTLWKKLFTVEGCDFVENENYECHYAKDDMIGLGGGVTFNFSVSANITIKDSHFVNNSACVGGGIHVYHRGPAVLEMSVEVIGSEFNFNRAIHEGGGLFLQQRPALFAAFRLNVFNSHFLKNVAEYGGGLGVYNGNNLGLNMSTVRIENSTWLSNKAVKSGFGLGLSSLAVSAVRPTGTTQFNLIAHILDSEFQNNTFRAYWSANGAVHLQGVKANFEDTKFLGNDGTALYLHLYSYATFSGEVLFSGNRGSKGGALHIELNSIASLSESDVNVTFKGNHATIDGGAVYLEYTDDDLEECLFDSMKAKLLKTSERFKDVKVLFDNNTAGALKVGGADQSIFIDNAGSCLRQSRKDSISIDHSVSMTDILLFDERIFMYNPLKKTQVASYASNIELHFDAISDSDPIQVMPGEFFHLNPTATDLFGNPAYQDCHLALTITKKDEHAIYTDVELVGPNFISIDSFTPNNHLYIKSDSRMMNREDYELHLRFYYAQRLSKNTTTQDLELKLVNCKVGFKFNSTTQVCKCNTPDDNMVCNSNNSYACVKYGYWHSNRDTLNSSIPCPGENCDYHNGHCPNNSISCANAPGYCLLRSNDSLCREGRGGILCSKCNDSSSFTFAGVKCVSNTTCRPRNTALLALGLIAYWIFLVIFILFVLSVNLSMGSGVAYGIMYFFSVVVVFTKNTVTESVLQTVISTSVAVTQLYPRVFGVIPICFGKNWSLSLHHQLFHYVTPVVVIFLIAAVIFSGRFCRCPRSLSPAQNSPIHAICILILASYTSLTYTSFEILRPIQIGGEWRVYIDPEVKYFHLQHLPYALVALCFELLISIPICILILFAPCLSGRVNLVKLRLKPILDEFQACYRPECRWFAGFYFLARQLIFFANIIPTQSLPEDNTYLHTLNAAIFIVYCAFQPYQLKWLNMLDTVLLADIIFLSFFRLEFSSIASRIVSYVLILLPSLCLALLILLVIIKRMSSCFRKKRKESPENTRELPSNLPTHTSMGINDTGEHEPLLSESRDSGRSTLSQGINSNEKDEKDGSKTFTTSSVRIS